MFVTAGPLLQRPRFFVLDTGSDANSGSRRPRHRLCLTDETFYDSDVGAEMFQIPRKCKPHRRRIRRDELASHRGMDRLPRLEHFANAGRRPAYDREELPGRSHRLGRVAKRVPIPTARDEPAQVGLLGKEQVSHVLDYRPPAARRALSQRGIVGRGQDLAETKLFRINGREKGWSAVVRHEADLTPRDSPSLEADAVSSRQRARHFTSGVSSRLAHSRMEPS